MVRTGFRMERVDSGGFTFLLWGNSAEAQRLMWARKKEKANRVHTLGSLLRLGHRVGYRPEVSRR